MIRDIRMENWGCSGEDEPVAKQQELIVSAMEAAGYLAVCEYNQGQRLEFFSVKTKRSIPPEDILRAAEATIARAKKKVERFCGTVTPEVGAARPSRPR